MTDALGDARSSFLDSLGDRGRRRAEPRTSISLAGAGCTLGIVGVLALAGDTGIDDESGDFSQVPGILLSALVVAIGYFVLTAARRGPVATAGTVAAALGVPAFMFFVTFDENGFPPYNTEAILIVSTAVWLGTYLIGPGRGRPFFLGSGLIALWFTVLELTENVFESPFDPFGSFFVGVEGSQSFEATGDVIDPSTGEIIELRKRRRHPRVGSRRSPTTLPTRPQSVCSRWRSVCCSSSWDVGSIAAGATAPPRRSRSRRSPASRSVCSAWPPTSRHPVRGCSWWASA